MFFHTTHHIQKRELLRGCYTKITISKNPLWTKKIIERRHYYVFDCCFFVLPLEYLGFIPIQKHILPTIMTLIPTFFAYILLCRSIPLYEKETWKRRCTDMNRDLLFFGDKRTYIYYDFNPLAAIVYYIYFVGVWAPMHILYNLSKALEHLCVKMYNKIMP